MEKLNLDLYKNKKKIINNMKYELFNDFYNNIIKKIHLYANNLKEECLYEIPLFVFGKSNYNLDDAIEYLVYKLNKDIDNGNLKKYIIYKPNIIYISWTLD